MTIETEWDSFIWEDIGDYGAGKVMERGSWYIERVEDRETACAAEGMLVRVDEEVLLTHEAYTRETLAIGFYAVFSGDLGERQILGPVSGPDARLALGDYTIAQYEGS